MISVTILHNRTF